MRRVAEGEEKTRTTTSGGVYVKRVEEKRNFYAAQFFFVYNLLQSTHTVTHSLTIRRGEN